MAGRKIKHQSSSVPEYPWSLGPNRRCRPASGAGRLSSKEIQVTGWREMPEGHNGDKTGTTPLKPSPDAGS